MSMNTRVSVIHPKVIGSSDTAILSCDTNFVFNATTGWLYGCVIKNWIQLGDDNDVRLMQYYTC